jgi:phage gp29-like protein
MAAAIERINREMARILGVEQLLLGSDSKGSFALSKDKTQSFGIIVDSCLKELRETFEKDFLGPLWTLNGWDESLKPTFKIEKIQFRDADQLTSSLEQLARAGAPMAFDDPAINAIRSLLGLPNAPEEDPLKDQDITL